MSERCEHQGLLTLFNESWLGAGAPKKHLPALNALVPILDGPDSIRFECAPLLENQNRKNGIDHYEQIKSDIAALSEALDGRQPLRLRNVGCDCGTEFAPVSYLLSRYQNNLAVVWFDAHGDLNTPSSSSGGSPSGHFHGMALRALIGHPSFGLSDHLRHALAPSQFILAGVRELDPEEHDFIEAENISVISPEHVAGKVWLDALNRQRERGATHVYVHIDFDVLDPSEFPWVGCPTPGGISIKALRQALEQIFERFHVAGVSTVEISADGDHAITAARIVQQLLCNRR
jgi:arginase